MINDSKVIIRTALINSTSYTNSNIFYGNFEQSLNYDSFAVIQTPLISSYDEMSSENRQIIIQIQHFVKKKNDNKNHSLNCDLLNYNAEKVLKSINSGGLVYVRTILNKPAILVDEYFQSILQIVLNQEN